MEYCRDDDRIDLCMRARIIKKLLNLINYRCLMFSVRVFFYHFTFSLSSTRSLALYVRRALFDKTRTVLELCCTRLL